MKLKLPLILILTLSLALTGCATHHARRPHGGKLSEAMEKGSDSYPGERRIETPQGSEHIQHPAGAHHDDAQSPPPTGTVIVQPEPEPPDTGVETEESPDKGAVICLAGGVGLFKSDEFHPLTHFDVSLGFYEKERHRFEVYGGLGWARVDQSDVLEDAINDGVTILSLGLRYKYFTTPRYTFLGHYLTLGGAYTKMFWRYRNDIEVDGRTVGSDAIDGLELFAGMGFHLAQTQHFQFGLEVLPSVILWSAYTDEGFDNDVFSNPLMLKLRLTASYLP